MNDQATTHDQATDHTDTNAADRKRVRKMTRRELRYCIEILEGRSEHGRVLHEHPPGGVFSYLNGWSDAKIAGLIADDIHGNAVGYTRVEAFGPAPEGQRAARSDVETLASRVDRVEQTLCKLHEELENTDAFSMEHVYILRDVLRAFVREYEQHRSCPSN